MSYTQAMAAIEANSEPEVNKFLDSLDPLINDLGKFISTHATGLTADQKKNLRDKMIDKVEEVLKKNIAQGKYSCLQGLKGFFDNRSLVYMVKTFIKKI